MSSINIDYFDKYLDSKNILNLNEFKYLNFKMKNTCNFLNIKVCGSLLNEKQI